MQRWTSLVKTAKHQIYISQCRSPFLNLSIEHYLLQNSNPVSTILILYVNEPCVVIGRNQNPWLEANLSSLKPNLKLVRRRSGGGTVYHDEGNVNYSVICPTADFTRDKHAEMVTKAIRIFNDRARVNERHDIVIDVGPLLPQSQMPPETDMHRTKYDATLPPLKVSGSAYKMVRGRCLHHGTCLVASSQLHRISTYLQSPAQAFIKAKGVDSVRSPISNVLGNRASRNYQGLESEAVKPFTVQFQALVVSAFAEMYRLDSQHIQQIMFKELRNTAIWEENDLLMGYLSPKTRTVQEIADGVEYLKSNQWIYGQTPEFTLSSNAVERDNGQPPSPSISLPPAHVYLKSRGGVITETNISISSGPDALNEQRILDAALKGKHIFEIRDFHDISRDICIPSVEEDVHRIMSWLNVMFGKPDQAHRHRPVNNIEQVG